MKKTLETSVYIELQSRDKNCALYIGLSEEVLIMRSVGTSNVGQRQRPIDFYTTSRMQNARVREVEKKMSLGG